MNNTDLLGCVRSLREIRTQLNHVLDPSISMEFDSVIGQLQDCLDRGSGPRQPAKCVDRAVLFFGRLLDVATNVSDLIDRYKN